MLTATRSYPSLTEASQHQVHMLAQAQTGHDDAITTLMFMQNYSKETSSRLNSRSRTELDVAQLQRLIALVASSTTLANILK